LKATKDNGNHKKKKFKSELRLELGTNQNDYDRVD
jgi:hypothetical protein